MSLPVSALFPSVIKEGITSESLDSLREHYYRGLVCRSVGTPFLTFHEYVHLVNAFGRVAASRSDADPLLRLRPE